MDDAFRSPPHAATRPAADPAGETPSPSVFQRLRRWLSLRRYLPKSLIWRTVFIVVAPMAIFQLVVASLIVERHYDGVTRQMTDALSKQIRYLVDIADTAPSPEAARAEFRRASERMQIPISLAVGGTIAPSRSPAFFDVTGRAVEETLRARLKRPIQVRFLDDEKRVDILVETAHGLLRIEAPQALLIARNPHLLLVWSAITGGVLILVALLYLRNQIRPITSLAKAATAFGRGRSAPVRMAGAREVRAATAAFLDMRNRIEKQIEQRTRMLSAVSHDMRTPLTRMKLALEIMREGPEIDELRRDVRDLEHILEEFLAFARGDHGEAATEVAAPELVREVVAAARRRGGFVSLFEQIETPESVELLLRPVAMKRCLHNLVENALTYGSRCMVSVKVDPRFVEILVEDDGPGIPAEARHNALKPFNRLDEARNQDKSSGVGLGLSIAHDTVRGHGGALRLSESARLGGLAASVRLPR